MQCPTVQIQIAPSEANPSGVVVINEEDYDAGTMTLVGAEPPAPPAQDSAAAIAAAESAALAAAVVTPPWASK